MTESLAWLALQRYAKESYQAYEIILKNTKSDMELMSVKYFLLCRNMELSFKSILLYNKLKTLEELKNKYGHDLDLLTNSVILVPTITLNDQEITIIKILNGYYKDKQFEYPKTGFKTFPVLEDVANLCKRFIWP